MSKPICTPVTMELASRVGEAVVVAVGSWDPELFERIAVRRLGRGWTVSETNAGWRAGMGIN